MAVSAVVAATLAAAVVADAVAALPWVAAVLVVAVARQQEQAAVVVQARVVAVVPEVPVAATRMPVRTHSASACWKAALRSRTRRGWPSF